MERGDRKERSSTLDYSTVNALPLGPFGSNWALSEATGGYPLWGGGYSPKVLVTRVVTATFFQKSFDCAARVPRNKHGEIAGPRQSENSINS